METLENVEFKIRTIENAPEASKPILKAAKAAYGFEANLLGLMANHPALLYAYWEGDKFLTKNSVLTAKERQIAFLASSYENNCQYCMAAHSSIAQMNKVPQENIDALREGRELPDKKLNALSEYVKATTTKRGQVTNEDIGKFLDAGYTKEAMLEVITIVGFKVMTNYMDHLAQTPVDHPFQGNLWIPRK
ncbi:carboxymuconolactone decarboxylase family protein [Flagellimonas sp. 2504JD1-5]|nr:carboxymuconolactone decarboxylase family protein [uncultured Allomuricauda sp.]